MKKIEFGFDDTYNPTGSWKGLGIVNGSFLTEATYIGSLRYKNNNFIIAKIEEDKSNRYANWVNKFIVRDAIVDIFADGSTILYLDQEQSELAIQMENKINDPYLTDRITDLDSVLANLNNVHRTNAAFKLAESASSLLATTILHEVFEEKKQAIISCQRPMSELNPVSKKTRSF